MPSRRRCLISKDLNSSPPKNKKPKTSKNDIYDKNNFLCEITKKTGLILKDGTSTNNLDVTKSSFQKQFATLLKTHSGDLLGTVEMFIEDFTEYIEDQQRFHKSLTPCEMCDGEGESAQTSQPESVVRLLLGVDVIQSPLMTALLEKLHEFSGDEEDFIFHQGQRIYLPRLVLSQFRFLDRIVDGKELAKKLLEILSSIGLDVQKEIIACLPDIVEDTEHGEVAKKLRDELLGNRELTCAVIDALTSLNIPTDLVTEVRNSVLGMLKSFHISDLPVVLNFLLESTSAQDALEVVTEIRLNVDFTVSSKLSKEEMGRVRSDIKLTMDALKGRMQFQRFVTEAWIKVIDTAKDSSLLDIFVLLILHWMNNKKSVETLVRNRIRSGLLTESLLTNAFTAYTQVVRDYFPSVQDLARVLLRCPEPTVSLIGCTMYKLAFTSFDAYCKQEIVGSLVTHIGSGYAGEIDASLNILWDLVKTQLQEMSCYAVLLKGVLDYLDHNNLTIAQICRLYLILAQLAFHSSRNGSYLQDDLHIIIRKQLTSSNQKYKRMGVTGAISIVQAIAAKKGNDTRDLSADDYNEVVELLQLVRSSGRKDPEIAALFMDSLATMMINESLYKNVETWVAENMTQTFEENYVVDLAENTEQRPDCLFPVEGLYDLNSSDSSIVINLVPLVHKLYEKSAKKAETDVNALCLCPLFRLVTVCETLQADGDLENIDAVLGCPVYMTKSDVYDRVASLTTLEKNVLCASLFLCINWFREVVNSFAASDCSEMKKKVLARLCHITELMAVLKKCLAAHSSFQPPSAIFDSESNLSPALPSTSGTKPLSRLSTTEKDKTKAKAPRAKKGQELDITDTQTSQVSNRSQDESVSSKAEPAADLSHYRQFFRELDISVFSILKLGLRVTSDSDESDKDPKEMTLGVPQLQFLLEDLSVKLNHILIASVSKRRSFLKSRGDKNIGFSNLDHHTSSEIMKKIISLLPHICNHLEEIFTYFQTKINENDGLVDGPGQCTEEFVSMGNCYHLIMQCLLSIFSWNGFVGEANVAMLKKALMVITERMRASQDSSTFVSQQDALSLNFQYLVNFVETLPNLETSVTLLKLLIVLAEKSQRDTLSEKLATHAKALLTREWLGSNGERLKGAKHNELLQMVVKTYVVYSSKPLNALEELVFQGLAELIKVDKHGCSTEFASLNRATFPVFFKVILSELINVIKRIPLVKKADSDDVKEDNLLTWMMAIKVFHSSVSLTKVFQLRSNLTAVLKYGRQFVEAFLRQGMPLLDVSFLAHHEKVGMLLRSLQQSTRILHHLCGHSKIHQDIAMTNQVPMLKRSLEAFVYRVKAMLALNNCQGAFWMGNLKNRNLEGEEILTQASGVDSSNTHDNDGDDDEEENDNDAQSTAANDDDDESEVEMDQREETRAEDSNADGGSYSEVF